MSQSPDRPTARTRWICIQVSDAELARINHLASQARRPRSAYVRASALGTDVGRLMRDQFIRALLVLIQEMKPVDDHCGADKLLALLQRAIDGAKLQD